MKNYYRILEIETDAEPEAIERAYERLARRFNPANNPSNEAKARLRNVNEAYEVLGKARSRAEYDRKFLGGRQAEERPAYEPPADAPRARSRGAILAMGILVVAAASAVAVAIIVLVSGGDDDEPLVVSPTVPPLTTPGTLGPESPPAIDGEPNVTESGLQIVDVTVGTGAEVVPNSFVAVHYTGWLEDGTKFSSSLDTGEPITATLGLEPDPSFILGWEEGLLGMKVGGMRRLIIPPELAYGEAGFGSDIPPNATLIFDLELVETGAPGGAPDSE